MEAENNRGSSHDSSHDSSNDSSNCSADKHFTRSSVKAIVRSTELTMVKELVNNVVNEFITFIHSNECIGKNRWEKIIDCHIRIATHVSDELLQYFEAGMCRVLPTGDPFTVSVNISWY